jgi:hypothetical protein
MRAYDASVAPHAASWLRFDEQDRLDLAVRYHRRIRADLPNERVHAAIHVIIENQLAMGIPEVVETLARLRREGLTRHDSIHAIGSVLIEHLSDLIAGGRPDPDANTRYLDALPSLTATAWQSTA